MGVGTKTTAKTQRHPPAVGLVPVVGVWCVCMCGCYHHVRFLFPLKSTILSYKKILVLSHNYCQIVSVLFHFTHTLQDEWNKQPVTTDAGEARFHKSAKALLTKKIAENEKNKSSYADYKLDEDKWVSGGLDCSGAVAIKVSVNALAVLCCAVRCGAVLCRAVLLPCCAVLCCASGSSRIAMSVPVTSPIPLPSQMYE